MKKEINSKSKRKWVAGGLAAFASIALLTTGFATWVVGNTSLKGEGMVTVDVDTAVNKNIEFTATIDDAQIKLGETSSETGDNKFVKTDGPVDGDLKISFSALKIVYGRDSGFNPANQKLKFSIDANKTVNAPAEDPFGRTESGLTYIEAPTEVSLSEASVGSDERPGTGSYTYTFAKLSFSFRWGTFFGTEGKSPLEFYNSKFDAESNAVAKTSENAQKVVDELNAMHDAFKSPNNTIKLKLEIVDAAA